MDTALIALWDRGVHFSYDGEPFRARQNIPNADISGVTFTAPDVRDADLAHILSLRNLSSISLWQTSVSDSALQLLSQLPRLSQLILCGTPITDASVPMLVGMSLLQYLDVADTQLSPAGIAAIKKGLPNTELRS